MQCSR